MVGLAVLAEGAGTGEAECARFVFGGDEGDVGVPVAGAGLGERGDAGFGDDELHEAELAEGEGGFDGCFNVVEVTAAGCGGWLLACRDGRELAVGVVAGTGL